MCSACVERDSFVQFQTAMGSMVQPVNYRGRLTADAIAFVSAIASGSIVVAFMVMRNASLPSASALVPGLLGVSDSESFVAGDGLRNSFDVYFG